MTDTKRLSLTAYLMYFFAGSTVILPGVLMDSIAKTMGVNTADVGSCYASAGFGMLLTVIFSGYLAERFDLKKVLHINMLALGAAVALLSTWHSMTVFAIGVFVVGLCGGIFICTANFLLVHLYQSVERSSKLIFLDFLFSFGALIYPIIASQILAQQLGWSMVYQSILITALAIFFVMRGVPFPHFEKQSKAERPSYTKAEWRAIAVVTLASFFYTSSEVSFSFWVVEYLSDTFSLTVSVASMALTIFWIAIAVGRFISSYLIKQVAFARYIMASMALALVAYAFLFQATSIQMAFTIIGAMGLGYACLYPSIIAYGTLIVPKSSPTLVSIYLTGGTIGFMAGASLLTSEIKRSFGVKMSMAASLGFLVLVFAALAVSFMMQRRTPAGREVLCGSLEA